MNIDDGLPNYVIDVNRVESSTYVTYIATYYVYS